MPPSPDVKRSVGKLASLLRGGLVGLVCAAGATALRGLLDLLAPDMTPYPLVFPAVLLATLASGVSGGLVALVLGMVATDYFFVPPRHTFEPENLTHGLSIAVTSVALLVVLWMTARYKKIMLSRAHEREEMMRTRLQIFEQSHGFMFVLRGPEFRYEYANPAYLRVVGKSKEDVLGKTFLEIVPNIEPTYLDMLAKVRRTGEVFVGRNVPRTIENGGVNRTFFFDLVCQPMRSEVGTVEAVFVEGYDVTDKVEAEQRLRFLVQEVDHRANNLLAVVQSIVKLTKANSVEVLRRKVLGRLGALASAHQLLSNSRWRGADLDRLVEAELRPYTLGDLGRAHVRGDSMPLSPAEAEALAMSMHELATNAAKYGALSTPAGGVEVVWTRDRLGARHIRWKEDGGPPVVKPDHKGLGIRLLERTLAAVPGASTRLIWRPEGLVCEFDLPPQSEQEPRGPIDEQTRAPRPLGLATEPPRP